MSPHLENYLAAAAVILLVSLAGCVTNILAGFIVVRNPVLKNAFGALCFSHTVANFGILFVFVVWVTPTTILQYEYTELTFGKILGQINILFWNACCYSHLVISLNRFLTISMPTKVTQLFDYRNTCFIISFVWMMAVFHIIPYFWRDTCYIAYDPFSWTWNFASTPCGHAISTYSDYYTSVSIFVVITIMDLSTFAMLVLYRRKHRMTSDQEDHRRRRVETRFFIQSVVQGLIFFYEIFSFNYVSTFNSNQWFVFMTTTFAWELCHCLDGLVVVVFHFKNDLLKGRQMLIAKMLTPRSSRATEVRITMR